MAEQPERRISRKMLRNVLLIIAVWIIALVVLMYLFA